MGKQAEWLPKLAPHLPLAVPVQPAMGRAADGPGGAGLAYYWDTNPGMVRRASPGLIEVLADSSR
jgi:hypothetical protein